MSGPFADRRDAGRQLGARLLELTHRSPIVVALPRGGVPVAAEVAQILPAPLEFLAVRKLAPRENPELGIGALAEDGTCVIDPEAATVLRALKRDLDSIIAEQKAELRRRVKTYRGDRPIDLRDREVIVVDDGVATGVTDVAALRAVRNQHPRRVLLAVPVCPPEALERLRGEADEVVALRVPRTMRGVSQWYEDFSQVSDEQVLRDLQPRAEAAV
jgi:putative phosphoribosyl transferase